MDNFFFGGDSIILNGMFSTEQNMYIYLSSYYSREQYLENNNSDNILPLTIDNIDGLTIKGDITCNWLLLSEGIITTNDDSLKFINNELSHLDIYNGWVNGKVTCIFDETSNYNSFTFPIGDSTNMYPVDISFNDSQNSTQWVTLQSKNEIHPNAEYPEQTLKRYWIVNMSEEAKTRQYNFATKYNISDYNTYLTRDKDVNTMLFAIL